MMRRRKRQLAWPLLATREVPHGHPRRPELGRTEDLKVTDLANHIVIALDLGSLNLRSHFFLELGNFREGT